MNYGVQLDKALTNFLERMPSKPLKVFTTSVLVQKETGGNLAEILENISSVIRGGYRFQRKLNTLSAEGKLSVLILTALPVFLAAAMYVVAPDLISELFINPTGHKLLYGSLGLFVVGFFWVQKLVKIEV